MRRRGLSFILRHMNRHARFSGPNRTVAVTFAAVIFSASCASAEDQSVPQPAGPNAHFYTDCMADAAAHSTYDRDARYLRLGCYGAPAKAFFEALGARPPGKTFDTTQGGKHWRFTQIPEKNLYGLDGCWQVVAPSPGEAEFGCLLIYPAGSFLDQ